MSQCGLSPPLFWKPESESTPAPFAKTNPHNDVPQDPTWPSSLSERLDVRRIGIGGAAVEYSIMQGRCWGSAGLLGDPKLAPSGAKPVAKSDRAATPY